MNFMTDKQMAHMTPAQSAEKAIRKTLERIIEEPTIGYLCGVGTSTWSFLTEAYAMLQGVPVEDVRKNCIPKNAKDPRESYFSAVDGMGAMGASATHFDPDDYEELEEGRLLLEKYQDLCARFASAECVTSPHLANSHQHFEAIERKLTKESEAAK